MRVPGWPFISSIGLHLVGVAGASSIIALAPAVSAPPAVPIEVIRVEPPPPVDPPKPDVRKITPPRLAMRPQEVAVPTPLPPAPLQEEPRARRSLPAMESGGAPDTRLFSAVGSGEPGAGLASAGKLFGKGDLLLPGGGGGSGSGSGLAAGPRVASLPPETGDGGGLTEFARPLGGYQTKPHYPDSARRQGIEGVTTLRFQVLADGHVGAITVARSAGHTALDRAAVEAVKTWLFEPARRGKDPVSVWVTLPVHFQLQAE